MPLPILPGLRCHTFRLKWDDLPATRRYNRRRYHTMEIVGATVIATATGTVAARKLAAGKIFCAIKGDGQTTVKTPEAVQTILPVKQGHKMVELAKQMLRRHLVKQGTDMIVAGNLFYPEQGTAVGTTPAGLKRALV